MGRWRGGALLLVAAVLAAVRSRAFSVGVAPPRTAGHPPPDEDRGASRAQPGSMLKGFKEFVLKGNVLDLAVAVIIGAAFGRIVNALVESVLMPAISAVVGSPDFDSFAVLTVDGNEVRFGVLLTAVVNFLLVAAAVYFAIVLPMNKVVEARNRRLGVDPAEAEADPQVQLLTEIRDALRERA